MELPLVASCAGKAASCAFLRNQRRESEEMSRAIDTLINAECFDPIEDVRRELIGNAPMMKSSILDRKSIPHTVFTERVDYGFNCNLCHGPNK